MRLDPLTCTARLVGADFGVLGTVDAERGVHLVPVVFVVIGDRLAIPIDALKPKATARLRRVANVTSDARASVLVDHRSDDWRQLWWVRADLRATKPGGEAWREALAQKYPRYGQPGAIVDLMTFDIIGLTGWTAS